ncbi:hypothetical protein STEG23_016935 [Scotinomys teguina]
MKNFMPVHPLLICSILLCRHYEKKKVCEELIWNFDVKCIESVDCFCPSLLLYLLPRVLQLTGDSYILSSWRAGVFSLLPCPGLLSASPCPAFLNIAKSVPFICRLTFTASQAPPINSVCTTDLYSKKKEREEKVIFRESTLASSMGERELKETYTVFTVNLNLTIDKLLSDAFLYAVNMCFSVPLINKAAFTYGKVA